MWEPSFVAVRVLLGDSIDEAIADLPVERRPRVAALAAHVRDSHRSVRARGLADVVQEIAIAIRAAALR